MLNFKSTNFSSSERRS